MTDHKPLTDEELAGYEAALVPPRLIADLRAAWAEVTRQTRRAHVAEVEVERLRELADFARLLGPVRMVLDRCAQLAPGYQAEAEDMAQRIVDLIGHPVTDEPPHILVERDELRAEVERLRAALAEAIEEMEDMIGYVPDYFRKKWKHDEGIARARQAAEPCPQS